MRHQIEYVVVVTSQVLLLVESAVVAVAVVVVAAFECRLVGYRLVVEQAVAGLGIVKKRECGRGK